MKAFETGSQEHKTLLIDSIKRYDVQTLNQLKGAESGETILLIESFYDCLVCSSWDNIDNYHEVITDKPLLDFFTEMEAKRP